MKVAKPHLISRARNLNYRIETLKLHHQMSDLVPKDKLLQTIFSASNVVGDLLVRSAVTRNPAVSLGA